MILKVCGITSQEDADAAIGAGANAIGFNFYPKSARFVTPERAAGIATLGARRVGIFVDEVRTRVEEIARIAALDVAQLHGQETANEYPAGLTVWKAVRITARFDLSQYDQCALEALLLDGPVNGQTFDWALAAGTAHRIIVAGGLDASNVARAIALAHPWGVDSCSRIESAPGKKDIKKMTEFLQAARAALGA